ncbi:hypothetical protein DB346_11050 [Verrucomicrobia bacterium LW23]|nr:hypothetical protein DB346_11050 [Verrucomicrobia bacterium LW23]
MAVLAFYVLSIGPMSMALGVKSVFAFHGIRSARISFAHEEFTGRGRMEEDSFALKFEYAPLLFVCERNEAARHLLFGYLHLWGVDAHEADEK